MTPTRPTWQRFDGIESAMSRVGGEVADLLGRLDTYDGTAVFDAKGAVMEAARVLTDKMRAARDVVREVTLAERGPRR